MNLHIEQRPIFLVRAPDADGKLGEDTQGIEGLQIGKRTHSVEHIL